MVLQLVTVHFLRNNNMVTIMKSFYFSIIIVLLIGVYAYAFAAPAITPTWSYTAPTERENGAALSPGEIDHYNAYVSKDGNMLAASPFTVPATATVYSYTADGPGDYCAQLTTVDTIGLESVFSSEVCAAVPFGPKPPDVTGVTLDIQR